MRRLPVGLQVTNLQYSRARASRNQSARSVWSARRLLPLSCKPTIQSASKLAHSKRFATNFEHPHSPPPKHSPPAMISSDTDRLKICATSVAWRRLRSHGFLSKSPIGIGRSFVMAVHHTQ
jgi:hypothetical protein